MTTQKALCSVFVVVVVLLLLFFWFCFTLNHLQLSGFKVSTSVLLGCNDAQESVLVMHVHLLSCLTQHGVI